ncbi:diacylglycerol kinase family protein [Streptomyces acidiscabies]|uniref:Diacylglycerol kinase n=1 Tax=Streptomyces acidiscabies TaxID=42234 RepID=A0A0L0K8C7_9ACTN|nr:diacylglycerol kinase family protein [Streptomyces acidiscabies]KND34086.1 diacylglycerol kinase [Streptomyces acidiscabies]MDX2961512.1 diacylglycerol kinase family protein [Streptomyces acidiscabies]MDX3016620.1 diacylglycerol kinase family protein [Streptomyces acidiscabies]MDX3788475.1 diacylglycerol kinase family protein [Streptomyces acidiscabies]GAQ56559.1 putative lipid kinase [Streptomyces acidiscabies]
MATFATSDFAASDQLLVVIDPVARKTDGESVRIVKDVLSAGAATKVCLPDDHEEFARALVRRGSRRPVVVGDDLALVRAVSLLHRRRELDACVLSVVPVGGAVAVARALGVPTDTVAAARAVLDGVERRVDVLVDESDGVVLGVLWIPPGAGGGTPEVRRGPWDRGTTGSTGTTAALDGLSGARRWRRTCSSLVRALVPSREGPALSPPGPFRLRVEVDGKVLVGLDQPVESVSVTPGASGTALVEVRPVSVGAEASPLIAHGGVVTVSGGDFLYGADAGVGGPVRTRTWRVREGALGVVVPGV